MLPSYRFLYVPIHPLCGDPTCPTRTQLTITTRTRGAGRDLSYLTVTVSGVRVTQKADSSTDNWRTFDGDKGVRGLGIYNFCGRHV